MPNLTDLYNSAVKAETVAPAEQPAHFDAISGPKPDYGNMDYDKKMKEQEAAAQGQQQVQTPLNVPMGPQQEQAAQNNMVAGQQVGGLAVENSENVEGDPTSWSAEHTMRSFASEMEKSFSYGVWGQVVHDMGGLTQVVGAIVPGVTIAKGNIISNWLTELGAENMQKFDTYIPDELKTENIGWEDVINPKLYSIHLSRMLPQMIGFIKGAGVGSSIARKVGSKIATKVPGRTTMAMGKEVFGSGSGIAGKLATDVGLTAAGETVAGVVGGGLTSNLMAGMLNAAQLVNEHKDDKIEGTEELMWTEEQLGEMAANTMKNNAAWIGADMLSWGITYGGLGKLFKGKNGLKGGRVYNKAERLNSSGKMARYEMAPILKKALQSTGKFSQATGFEAVEESLQETWEEWASKKAYAEATGDPNDSIWDMDFFDYYMSPENRPTQVLSAIMGGVGANIMGGAGVSALMNQKADEHYKLYNRKENLSSILEHTTDAEKTWTAFHRRDQITDIVIDDSIESERKLKLINGFVEKQMQDGTMSEDQKNQINEMYNQAMDIKEKGEALNIKGLRALVQANSDVLYFEDLMNQYKKEAAVQTSIINEAAAETGENVAPRLAAIQKKLDENLKNTAALRAYSIEQRTNLLLGKKANPLKLKVEKDEYGNEIVTGGLSTSQFNEWTKDGEIKPQSKNFIDFKSLTRKGKEAINGVVDIFKKKPEKNEDGTPKEPAKSEEDTFWESVPEVDVTKEDFENFTNTGEVSEDILKSIAKKMSGKSKGNTMTAQERAIYNAKGAEVENFIKEFQASSETAAQNDSKSKEKPKSKAPKDEEGSENSGEGDNDQDEDVDDDPNISDKQKERERSFRKGESKIGQLFGKIKSFVSDNLKSMNKTLNDQGLDTDAAKNKGLDYAKEMWKFFNKTTGVPSGMKLKANTLLAQVQAILEKEGELTVEDKAQLKTKMQEISNLANTKVKTESLQDQKAKEDEEGEGNFKANKDAVDEAREDAKAEVATPQGNDARAMSFLKDKVNQVKNIQLVRQNLAEAAFFKNLRNRIKNFDGDSKSTDAISQNEIDNYLNKRSTINLYGPSDVDKMSAVNHAIKNIFPEVDGSPVRALIAKNLFDVVGSQGLGYSMASTMFIDTKAWDQDWVYMHELSHIFFQLGKHTPETKEAAREYMKNQPLVDQVMKNYHDMVIYNVKTADGRLAPMTKRDAIQTIMTNEGVPSEIAIQVFNNDVEKGTIIQAPMNEQINIIEEVFTHSLQGPLSDSFGKMFDMKNEPVRQKYTKKWWGAIRVRSEENFGESNVKQLLRTLDGRTPLPGETQKDYVLAAFKAVAKGAVLDSRGRDARVGEIDAEYTAATNDIANRVVESFQHDMESIALMDKKELTDLWEDAEIGLEENGDAFFNTAFNKHAQKATKMLHRFGIVYQKSQRQKFAKDNVSDTSAGDWKKRPEFDRDLFESHIFELAKENDRNGFIYQIENSALDEVQAFDRYMNHVYPETKMQLLNSMYYVMSNARHISGLTTVLTNNGDIEMYDSLSNTESAQAQKALSELAKKFKGDAANQIELDELKGAISRIYNNKAEDSDYAKILRAYSGPSIRVGKILNEGSIVYKGIRLPIESVITGMVMRGDFFFEKNGVKQPQTLSTYGGKFLAEAIVNTNRKFTPYSTIKNAQGNMESVRITNNNITNEVDDIIDFLSGKMKGKKPTKDQFLKRYSHENYKLQSKKGPNEHQNHNRLLEFIYDNYQKGIMPTVSQDHGLQDDKNDKGSVYKGSSDVEQRMKDFMTFVKSSRRKDGKANKTYLGQIGAFADSPRKFLMNMPRIAFEEVFNEDRTLKKDGKVLGSVYKLHQQLFNDDLSKSRAKFNQSLRDAINAQISFVNDNAKAFESLGTMKGYFANGKLTKEGENLVAEFEVNSAINGYNIVDAFLPGVKGDDVTKRLKMNGSPIFGFKNPNLKIEWMPFADEIIDGSVAGTDSGQYILQEDAEKIQNAGKGVFEIKDGIKILNGHIEKDNAAFRGKSAYLKGFTTVVDENHPLYPAMKARKEKYKKYHQEKFGKEASQDLGDGSFNHILIASPQSADKADFFPAFQKKNKATGKMEAVPVEVTFRGKKIKLDGALLEPEALRQNPEYINDLMDAMYYTNGGQFLGLSSQNFGPQQVMNGIEDVSGTPVQMVNSVLVNAMAIGGMDAALEIQELISEQKWDMLKSTLDKLADHDPVAYRKLLLKGLNKEDMNQGQRQLIEEGGSMAAPYNTEILVNQLAKTIRRKGNKLTTPGSLSQQKPDISYNVKKGGVLTSKRLKGYQQNGDDSNSPMEMVAPANMEGKYNKREAITVNNFAGKNAIANYRAGKSKGELERIDADREMDAIKEAARQEARKRHGVNGLEADKFIAPEYNEQNVQIGWHVKGDIVLATRVPSHGPAATGVFEIVDFDTNKNANQVMVPAEFNEIIGADNDGDALFIQAKGKGNDAQKYAKWNKAMDKMVDLWLSSDMNDQIKAKMDFQEEVKGVVAQLEKDFPKATKKPFPFSSEYRSREYNNTMVSKRAVGVVFNIHKIANMLAAYETRLKTGKELTIGGVKFDKFQDTVKGEQSRNHRSAILANIILDNAKHGFADSLGLNEHNISFASVLINMGVSLEHMGRLLNSEAAQLWAKHNRYNKSLFHDTTSREKITQAIYDDLGIDRPSADKVNVNPAKANEKSEQGNIVALFEMLSDINSEILSVSGIMSGHNKIHVNPLVLDDQLQKFEKTVNNKNENQTLNFSPSFKANPDLKNYERVARATLEHTQVLHPVYREATNKMLSDLRKKISGELTIDQIEDISKDILSFTASRLLGHNNASKQELQDIMSTDPNNKNSVFHKLSEYMKAMSASSKESLLLSKGLSVNLNHQYQKGMGIWANADMVNESFNKAERAQIQREFDEMPADLQKALVVYDLVQRGWKGYNSIVPYFGKNVIDQINRAADNDLVSKNSTPMSNKVIKELETTIALRYSQRSSNPFNKVRMTKSEMADFKKARIKVLSDKNVFANIKKNPESGLYVNVISKDPKTKQDIRKLFEIPGFTTDQMHTFGGIRNSKDRDRAMQNAAYAAMVEVPNNLIGNGAINLASIADNSTGTPIDPSPTKKQQRGVDHMTIGTIRYEDAMAMANEPAKMDARPDYDAEIFWQDTPLSFEEYNHTMEFNPNVSPEMRKGMYAGYLKKKAEANEIAKTLEVEGKSTEDLLSLYEEYGEQDAYAYSIVMTPILKELAKNLIADQAQLFRDHGVEMTGDTDQDISALNAMFISGSTIPSNHPAAQAMARIMEQEYKNFINEKKKYIKEMNTITQKLYDEKLNYGNNKIIRALKKLRDNVFRRQEVYQKLYGNLVIREEIKDPKTGKITYDFRLRPVEEIQKDFEAGNVSQAEKDFYDFFRKTTNELKPDVRTELTDYIPHTAMSTVEAFASRGLLGLMANSRGEDEALADVKLYHKNVEGERKLMTFRQIEDQFKADAAQEYKAADVNKILEYQKIKRRAKKLLKKGQNEDGSVVKMSMVSVETALGFGAINRFANNRSVKATELPSMDLNKALGDYIHATLFVNGNGNFQGMKRLQGLVDGVMAYNREKGHNNMNSHVQKVWKDYFIRGKRQDSVLGKKADNVIRSLTRMNLFYALGYQANKNTLGLYAVGNVLVGKYHNIKDLGGKEWIKGEAKYWGLDKGFEGGVQGVLQRHKRMQRILKNMNFMDINIYDEVNIEKKEGLDKMIGTLALAPMLLSEHWIQRVHMLGLLSEEDLAKFDDNGDLKPGEAVDNARLIELEDRVKASHGRGYQPTDQRAIQMYSYGNMMMQFAKFIPTMVHDRFSKKDVNIYGREHIGSLRAVGQTIRNLINNPDGKSMMEYYRSLSPEEQQRVQSGLRGMALTGIIGAGAIITGSKLADELYWDSNYYFNSDKLSNKLVPAAIQSTDRLISGLF